MENIIYLMMPDLANYVKLKKINREQRNFNLIVDQNYTVMQKMKIFKDVKRRLERKYFIWWESGCQK